MLQSCTSVGRFAAMNVAQCNYGPRPQKITAGVVQFCIQDEPAVLILR
jgi:hypothetical protein